MIVHLYVHIVCNTSTPAQLALESCALGNFITSRPVCLYM